MGTTVNQVTPVKTVYQPTQTHKTEKDIQTYINSETNNISLGENSENSSSNILKLENGS